MPPWIERLTVTQRPALRFALGIVAAATAVAGQLLMEDQRNIALGTALFALAALCIAAATWGLRFDDASEQAQDSRPRWRQTSFALPFALALVGLGVGIAFRAYDLASTPYGLWFDEAQNGIIADRILHELDFKPLYVTGYEGAYRPALGMYFYALSIAAFGKTALALRAVSLLASALTIIALYLFTSELLNRRVAALACVVLAVMRWHVTFSRLAMEPIWAPFFALAAGFFFVRGLRRNSRYELAAAGVMIGLGLYFYWAFIIFPPVLAIYALHRVFIEKSAELKPALRAIGVIAAVAFVVYLPITIYALQHPDDYGDRTSEVSITKDKSVQETIGAVVRNTKKHALMFNTQGDANPRHNIPHVPMLDTISASLLILGIGITLGRLREPRYLLLLLSLVALVQPAIWSLEFEAPQALRSILVTPILAILVALPLAALWSFPWRVARDQGNGTQAPGMPRRPGAAILNVGAGAIVLAALGAMAYQNFAGYFNNQVDRTDAWLNSSSAPTIAAREINRLRDSYTLIYLPPQHLGQPTLNYLGDFEVRDIEAFDPVGHIPVGERQPTAIFFDPSDRGQQQLYLRSLYPDAQYVSHAGPEESTQILTEALLSLSDIQSIMGISAVYEDASGRRVARVEDQIDGPIAAGESLTFPVRVVWSGYLTTRTYGEYTIGLRLPGEGRITLDGQLFAEGSDALQERALLAQGTHRLEIEALVRAPGEAQLFWAPPGRVEQPVPVNELFKSPVTHRGLLATYYVGDTFTGPPNWQRLDPFIAFRYFTDRALPAEGPFSVRWTGKLQVPANGAYEFQINASGDSELIIDGASLIDTTRNRSGVESIPLTAGSHDIEVTLVQRVGEPRIFLLWTPPGGESAVVPPSALAPY